MPSTDDRAPGGCHTPETFRLVTMKEESSQTVTSSFRGLVRIVDTIVDIMEVRTRDKRAVPIIDGHMRAGRQRTRCGRRRGCAKNRTLSCKNDTTWVISIKSSAWLSIKASDSEERSSLNALDLLDVVVAKRRR